MAEDLARQVVLAAINMSGNRGTGWAAKLRENILEVGKALSDGSRQLELAERILNANTFRAILERIEVEESSTRAVLHLSTEPSKWHLDGRETLRTERTDGAVGKAQHAKASSMIGAPVMVWLFHDVKDDVKYRVLLDIQQLGPTPTSAPQPAQLLAQETPPPAPAPPPPATAAPEPPPQLPLQQRVVEHVEHAVAPEGDEVDEATGAPKFISWLPAKHRVKVARRAMAEHQILNIYDWGNMTTEQKVGIRNIIDDECGESF